MKASDMLASQYAVDNPWRYYMEMSGYPASPQVSKPSEYTKFMSMADAWPKTIYAVGVRDRPGDPKLDRGTVAYNSRQILAYADHVILHDS